MAGVHTDRIVPQPVRDRDATGLRGLGGDVPVLRALRRAPAGAGRAALLVLELDALPAADAGVRPGLLGRPVHGHRHVAEPRVRRAAGHGHRLPGRQRLHLHLRESRHRPGQDRRARRVLPEAGRLLLPELGRALREVEEEDGRADRGPHRPPGPGSARVRARGGRVRGRPQHAVCRGARRVRPSTPLQRAHVAAPQRVPAPRVRRLCDVRRLLQERAARHPGPAHRADGRGHRRTPLQARCRAQAARPSRDRHRRRLGVRPGTLAAGDRRRARPERCREGMARGAREGQGPVVQHGDGRRPLPLLRQLARRSEHPVRVADRIRARL